MAKKKLKVDQSVCIGCRCCAGTYPDAFKIGDNGLAEAIAEADEEAVSVCPVGAISDKE